ncbi:hypothetical protein L2Y96_07370 [Luteibacter aegosomaticola]|uniref:hypothetical protein n=1 Tax=Luteibacter aegosomaticola TaxID=2911538 RepID=UPI001FFBC7F2|nr:hypothetical protein [Luteibacter aegosomaticola]UPG91582.1 hypothetical protein L2Y96_07370 [Luteibacter aegosomaticola]
MRRHVNHRALAGFALLAALPVAHAATAPSMCAKGDEAVLSCPLAKGGKTVSICAKSDNTFYYAYGKPGAKPDMSWPADGAQATGLTRTHLMFGGATGGNAYAFENNGYKYIVYSISGTQLEDGGVIVTKDGQSKPIKDSKCAAGAKTQTDNADVRKAARSLPEDPDLSNHGLPSN